MDHITSQYEIFIIICIIQCFLVNMYIITKLFTWTHLFKFEGLLLQNFEETCILTFIFSNFSKTENIILVIIIHIHVLFLASWSNLGKLFCKYIPFRSKFVPLQDGICSLNLYGIPLGIPEEEKRTLRLKISFTHVTELIESSSNSHLASSSYLEGV